MATVTVRISPPKPPKKRRSKAAPTPQEELGRFLRSHWGVLLPYGAALWLALATVIIQKKTNAPALWIFVALAGLEALVWWKGHMIGAIRTVERRYAYTIPAIAALWALYATWGGRPVTVHSVGLLAVLVTLTASPWWHHRRIRGSVKVVFEDLPRRVRDVRMKETKRLTEGWTAYTSAGHIQGARLRGLTFNEWSVAIHVRLRNGAHAGELQRPSRRRHLESASYWPVGEGTVRIQGDDNDSRNCTIRYMLKDPHAQPIIPDEDEIPTVDSLIIGLFETGAAVLFHLVNTLIAGETGAGKSTLINRIVQLLAKIPHVAVLGVDATSGATEFKPWSGVMHVVANTADEIEALFDQVMNECARRGDIMSKNGWKNFRCTVADPFMVLIVDEAQKVKEFKLDRKLAGIAAEIRKYGGCVIVATQYPTAPNLPKAITANLPQKIGLRTDGETADRVIFGNNATRNGWSPSVLIPPGRDGSFLIRSKSYGKPVLARCHYVSEAVVERENARWSPQRTAISGIDLRSVTHVRRERVEPGSLLTLEAAEAEEIVEAEIMDDTESLILDMIDRGVNKPKMIHDELISYGRDLTVRSVNRKLASLSERGYIRQLRKQGPWFRST